MKRTRPVLIVLAVFAADRLTKAWVLARFAAGESVPFVPGLLHWTRVDNTGAAFGFLRGSTPLLAAVSVFCIACLAFGLWRGAPAWNTAFSLILAGAAGNLYDRVRYGYVIDFIDLRVWPVFNLADTAITAGVCLVIARAILERRRSGR